ncbi:MAG: alpha-hydroxy acid oxidase [Candidatus Azotimanducaceae bacterium]|nr:alpha-hydroxy-acid oxidizing enzyme [Gammaproteobacteria bacterium]
MKLNDCHNFHDFRKLAKRRLPSPIFNYIDGAAEDETTYARNTASFEQCDLVPNVLRGTEKIDQSVEVMGQKLEMPIYCSPTALQRVFHHEGENAVAAAASKYGTLFGVSSLGTASLSDIRKQYHGPQCFQFYFHKDRGLNQSMLESAKNADVDVLMLTVDTITGGKRERDLRTGFSIPFKLTLSGLVQFIIKPNWGLNYITHPKFGFPQLDQFVDMSSGSVSVGKYFTDMLDPTMTWNDVEKIVQFWNGQFCLKGIMSVSDAKRAVDIGCTGIVVSNHGGRQLDGSRSSFDQLAEIVDAVGNDIDVIMDSGIQRGSHVLKALSLGAKAVGGGRFYLYALAAAGQAGVERALEIMRTDIERDMRLVGAKKISELSVDNLRFR